MSMADPFSPNRFIHEVESSSSMGVGRLRPSQGRRKDGHDADGSLARVSDHGSTPSHSIPRSRAATQTHLLATTGAADSTHFARPFSPRGIAVLSGVVISLLFFSIVRIWSLPSLPSPQGLDPAVKAYIDRAINRALRDSVGRRDFALLADGAIVLAELTKLVAPKGMVDLPPNSSLDVALNDDTRIGNCWVVPGSTVQLGLRLSAMIYPTHVSIDHIPFELATEIGRAPRSMRLWGGVDGEANKARLRKLEQSHHSPRAHGHAGPKVILSYDFALLGSFEYDIRGSSHVQTFTLEPYFAESGMYFGVVVLEIMSNWGANTTCLYRLRVHGDTYTQEN